MTYEIRQNYLQISKELREVQITKTLKLFENILNTFEHLSAMYEVQGLLNSQAVKMIASLFSQKVKESQILERNLSISIVNETQPKPISKSTLIDHETHNKNEEMKNKLAQPVIQSLMEKRFKKPTHVQPLKKTKIVEYKDNKQIEQISLISSSDENNSASNIIDPNKSKAPRIQNDLMNIFDTPESKSSMNFNKKQTLVQDKHPRVFKEVIRQKEARKVLQGHSCNECSDPISGLDLSSFERQEILQECTKHRGNKYIMNQALNIFPSPDG